MKEILTADQIADRLNVSRESVYRWLRSGKLIGFKAGFLWRVTEEQLQDFLSREQVTEQVK